MKRRPFLFALSFCLPVFFGLGAGAGRPIYRVAPSLAAIPVPVVARPAAGPFRHPLIQYLLTAEGKGSRDLPVPVAFVDVATFEHAGDAQPLETRRIPIDGDGLRTVSFSIPASGCAVLTAIAANGAVSEPFTCPGFWTIRPAPKCGTQMVRHVNRRSHTFHFPGL